MNKEEELISLEKLQFELFQQLEKVKLDIKRLYLSMPKERCNTCQMKHYGPWNVGSCRWAIGVLNE